MIAGAFQLVSRSPKWLPFRVQDLDPGMIRGPTSVGPLGVAFRQEHIAPVALAVLYHSVITLIWFAASL